MYGVSGRVGTLVARADEDGAIGVGRADAGAFRRVYAENAGRVFRLLARMGVPDPDLEDLLQEVFVAVHRKMDSFDGRVPFTTWIYAIALRVAKNHRRWRWRHRLERLVGLREDAEPPRDPECALAQKQAAAELARVLGGMKEKHRTVFVLYELEGLDGPAIAQVVGCPVHTVWSRLRVAREEVKRLVRRRAVVTGQDRR